MKLGLWLPTVVVVVGGGVALAIGRAAAPAHRRVSGLPAVSRVSYRQAAAGYVDVLVDGQFIAAGGAARATYARQALAAVFAARRRTLPGDASQLYIDRYSKGYFALPTWLLDGDVVRYNYRVVDEFGRLKPGHVGFGGSIGDSFTRLLANPLAQLVVQAAVLYATGPAGLAAYGAVRAYAERGAELTVKDVALATGKSAAVGYCGTACGIAFDFGVGVASGDSVDDAARRAIVGQLTPEQRAAYEQGRQAYAHR